MSTAAVKRVVIVGGGTAGWLVATTLAAQQAQRGVSVTLIESPDVATIGVGEGTWPSMRTTLQSVGIDELDFLKACDASFKQGTLFESWGSGDARDRYYHPFTQPQGYGQVDLHLGWQQLANAQAFSDTVSVQSSVCEKGLAPKQLATPAYAGVTNYGYHLDAGKFAALLCEHGTTKLGVHHLLDHVMSVQSHPNGDIKAIETRESGSIEGDLFIDCSGFNALLIGKHFGIPFKSMQSVLFNDSAFAVQVPYTGDEDIASVTRSTALSAGWVWDIGLTSRRGVGYVFSSGHSSDEAALRELKQYIHQTSKADPEALQYRKIQFESGYRETLWCQNCVAVGMSSGFLEPLEASALAMVELSCTMINDNFPATRDHMDIVAKRFNARFVYRWQRVVDFLKLHYAISHRDDSQYWRDNRLPQSMPDSLAESLALWRHQPPNRHDLMQNEEVFPSASYQYVLYGMGFETKRQTQAMTAAQQAMYERLFADNQQKTQACLAGLPSNRTLLNELIGHAPQSTSKETALEH